MLRYLFVVLAGLLFPVLSSAQCLTTLPPNPPFVPPLKNPSSALGSNMFWYGTDALWTSLSFDGKWTIQNNVLAPNGYRAKLVFWRRGFDWHKELEPEIIVTGKRIDGDAPSVAVAHAHVVFIPDRDTPGMMTLIDIPKAGCWELTAHYGGHTLSFIVLVEP